VIRRFRVLGYNYFLLCMKCTISTRVDLNQFSYSSITEALASQLAHLRSPTFLNGLRSPIGIHKATLFKLPRRSILEPCQLQSCQEDRPSQSLEELPHPLMQPEGRQSPEPLTCGWRSVGPTTSRINSRITTNASLASAGLKMAISCGVG
jgi:hypothetical protein